MRKGELFGFFIAMTFWAAAIGLFLIFITSKVTGYDLIHLLMQPIYAAPVIVYLTVAALMVSSGATLIVGIRQRLDRRRLDQELSQLLSGHYQAAIFNHPGKNQQILGQHTAELLEALRQKMIRLQREIERYNNIPVLVSGETKEEVLQQERHRLARELHDSVSQQLFAAMMMLSAIQSAIDQGQSADQFTPQLKTIQQVINEAQSEMRALLLHLRPTTLAGKTLKQGILTLLEELQTKITITIKWQLDDIKLSSAMEDNLFRIVQELLSNTLRHAKASELEVYLKQVNDVVILRVVDDGVGFDVGQEAENNGSYGLANIKERAASMGGTANVISVVDQGTSVEIRIPLTKEVAHDKSTDR